MSNGSTFALSYTNPHTLTTGTQTVTFSTSEASLQLNIQNALNAMTQIGSTSGTPNSVVVATNDVSTGANVLVTFQAALAQASNQLLTTTTPGVTIAAATINAANNIAGSGIPIALSTRPERDLGELHVTVQSELADDHGNSVEADGAGSDVHSEQYHQQRDIGHGGVITVESDAVDRVDVAGDVGEPAGDGAVVGGD